MGAHPGAVHARMAEGDPAVVTGPEPGDFAVVSAGGTAGRLVAWGERLNGTGFSQYQHAFIYIGNSQVVQAEPAGACIRPLTGHTRELWSTGIIPLTGPQRAAIVNAAHRYAAAEVDYSFLDYLALAARRFRLPVPGLRRYIAATGHQICSQMVDSAYLAAGVHLFDDGRWPGYVTPADLAARLS